jgi:hypothetical protein
MRISAGFKGPIASAVVGEVIRLEQHPDFWKCEGGAYKAAWDRMKPADSKAPGSPALNLCDSHLRDCTASALYVKFGRRLVMAAVDASLVADRRRDLFPVRA